MLWGRHDRESVGESTRESIALLASSDGGIIREIFQTPDLPAQKSMRRDRLRLKITASRGDPVPR